MHDVFQVAEKFISINGEGRFAGELAVFIRFAGCNLNCSYCDTAWAIPMDCPSELLSLEDIIRYVNLAGVRRVTLTGGEPLLQESLPDLVAELIGTGHLVEIETNGAVDITPLAALADELNLNDEMVITLDYKCPGSGMEQFMLEENYDLLAPCDVVKFVVSDINDLDRARDIIYEYGLTDKCGVYLSAVFDRITPEEIVEYMKQHKMNRVVHQLQQHKYIWAPDKRGV